jgi:two-component system KDP operon response regulator KdpE
METMVDEQLSVLDGTARADTAEERLVGDVGRPSVVFVNQRDGTDGLPERLAREGFEVRDEHGPPESLASAGNTDVVLFETTGSEIPLEQVRRLRRTYQAPVIALVPDSEVARRVQALEAGTDDCLAQPASVDELAARIRAVLRRRPARLSDRTMVIGELELDFERRLCRRDGVVVPLPRSEWRVLSFLARNRGRPVIATEILRQCWGPAYENDLQVLRICISRLRRKLGSTGREGPIRTYHNVGYSLDA